ncbi:hypothetical protein A3Q56_08614, partial [Intoshia linei]
KKTFRNFCLKVCLFLIIRIFPSTLEYKKTSYKERKDSRFNTVLHPIIFYVSYVKYMRFAFIGIFVVPIQFIILPLAALRVVFDAVIVEGEMM